MTTQMIKVEGLPEGWKAVAYRVPVNGENFFYDEKICNDKYQRHEYLIVEKIQPRRIVLEETNEERRICFGEWYESQEGKLMRWPYGGKTDGKHKVWREVKETDIPLHKVDDKVKMVLSQGDGEPKLELSVEQCRKLCSRGLNHVEEVIQIVREFIKDK